MPAVDLSEKYHCCHINFFTVSSERLSNRPQMVRIWYINDMYTNVNGTTMKK